MYWPLLLLFCILVVASNAELHRGLFSVASSAAHFNGKYDSKDRAKVSRSLVHNSFDSLLALRGGGGDLSAGTSIDWRYFLAGGLGAAISHGITTPIDVVKTRMQTSPEKYTQGLLAAASSIVDEFGVMFLLAGLGPTFLGYGFEGAMKFGFYETFKVIFGEFLSHIFSSFTTKLLASIIAGAIASIILCPMEETRIKMVGDASWKDENTVSGLMRLAKESGIFSTLGGLPAMLSKQVPYTMGKQVSFDVLKKFVSKILKNYVKDTNSTFFSFLVTASSAFMTSLIACLASQPGDMLLTATYKASDGKGRKDVVAITKDILNEHGVGGFFLGVQARIAHVAFIITIQLVVYDAIKSMLGLGLGH
jgi:solute carrier family 25 (mitochondrial phosphate transporter), member 3